MTKAERELLLVLARLVLLNLASEEDGRQWGLAACIEEVEEEQTALKEGKA